MSDISASERRLSAALDRIDQLLEAGAGRPAPADDAARAALQARLDEVQAENVRLAAQLDALSLEPAPSEAVEVTSDAALVEAHRRLTGASEQASRLAAANDQLAAANRALMQAGAGQGDADNAARDALEAEIEALRAARAAEIAQMGDIMMALERLLDGDAQGDSAPAPAEPVQPDFAADGSGVPEADGGAEAAQSPEGETNTQAWSPGGHRQDGGW